MKNVALCTAITALCAATTAASAGIAWDPALDELILINDTEGFTLEDGETASFSVNLTGQNTVVGFSFAGVWAGGGGAWASDTIMTITAPDSTQISRGGFPAPGGDQDWDFQGGVSSGDGMYSHGFGSTFGDGDADLAFAGGVSGNGTWTFEFEQTWGVATWKGVSIVLHQIPAPGALALLGLAGLVGVRRRRD